MNLFCRGFSVALLAAFPLQATNGDDEPRAGGDWPQFRFDARRGAASPAELPEQLHLQWIRDLGPPRPAFPNELRLRFDGSYEPVTMGKTLFVPSTVTDSVTALDTDSGEVRWRFFAEGPVRFAPVAWEDRVYFVSDDSHLYCVSAKGGELLWKFSGVPAGKLSRLLMGDGRLVSLHPARGGPVLENGVVYFGAGIWLGDGTFVHALDARSGELIWSNTDSNLLPGVNNDHSHGGDGGISPQGYLAILNEKLVVPCGNQLPAFLDPKTGILEPYTMGWGGRTGVPKGSWLVSGAGPYLVHTGDLFELNPVEYQDPKEGVIYPGYYPRWMMDPGNIKTKSRLKFFREPVLAEDTLYFSTPDVGIEAFDLSQPQKQVRIDRKGNPEDSHKNFPKRWTFPSSLKIEMRAGSRLYAGGPGVVEAIDLPKADGEPRVSWRTKINGTPGSMLAADGKLFIVTTQGWIYAFGGERVDRWAAHDLPKRDPGSAKKSDEWTARAKRILEESGDRNGYALILGAEDGRLADELIQQSALQLIVIDPDVDRVRSLREEFHKFGLYGKRIAVHAGDPKELSLPPFFASLIVSETDQFPASILRCLRPYGGSAVFTAEEGNREALIEILNEKKPAGVEIRLIDDFVVANREGPLPGAADWSHNGGDATNSGASQDDYLKPPLGILWFDGSNRWFGWGGFTAVRVSGGRLLVLRNSLTAFDVFTGRKLWNAGYSNQWAAAPEMVAADDAIYVLERNKGCLVFDPVTGKKRDNLEIPSDLEFDSDSPAGWSTIRVSGNSFIGMVGPELVCLDRNTGKLRWKFVCQQVEISLAVGKNRVFCAEIAGPDRRKGPEETGEARTTALDLDTGEVLWQIAEAGDTHLSETYGLLVTPGGIYRAEDGSRIRESPPETAESPRRADLYASVGQTSFAIAGNAIICKTKESLTAYDLSSGAKAIEALTWQMRGCTFLRSSPHLSTTRFHGNAAYVDLETREITPLWNIRSGCNNNLFPANGVLAAPGLTSNCACNYLPVSMGFAPAAVLNTEK